MRHFKSAIAVGLFALAFSGSAHAVPVVPDLTVTNGQNQQPAEDKIYLNAATSTTVTGQVGSQNGTPTITFVSGSGILVDAKNGFASIDATGNGQNTIPYTSLTISAPTGYTFTDLVFDVLNPPNFTVMGSNGGTASITNPGNGLQEYTVLANNGTSLTSLTLSSAVGFTQIKQFEISGLMAAVPEPSTWAMMLLGFCGLGFLALRRRNFSVA